MAPAHKSPTEKRRDGEIQSLRTPPKNLDAPYAAANDEESAPICTLLSRMSELELLESEAIKYGIVTTRPRRDTLYAK